MQEYWFCSVCSSMNRADARQCYKCRAAKEQATLATVQERHLDDVAMPGVDQLEPGHAAFELAYRSYVTVWPLGWVSAVPIFLASFFTIGLALATAALLLPLAGPVSDRLSLAWLVLALGSAIGYGISWWAAMILHSIYLGLVDGNVPSLGGGTPSFGPWRAAGWWIESWLWTLRASLLIYGPLFLSAWVGSNVSGILGLVVLPGSYVAGFWMFGSPLYALRKPGRLLQDLLRRLSLSGPGDSGLASLWSGAWMTARMIVLAYPFLLLAIGFVEIILLLARVQPAIGSVVDSRSVVVLAVSSAVVLGVVVLVADAVAYFVLGRITLSLCRSERNRRRWVLGSTGLPSGGQWTPINVTPAAPPPPPTPAQTAQPGPPSTPQPARPAPPPIDAAAVSDVQPRPVRPQPAFEPLPTEDLPPAWRRAIGQSTSAGSQPAQPAPPVDAGEQESEPADRSAEPASDRPVIQPSSPSISRYRAPGDVPPAEPVESPPNDLDMGGGI